MVNPNIVTKLPEYGSKILAWFNLAKEAVEKFGDEVGKLFPDLGNCVEEVTVDDTLTKDVFLDIIKKNAVKGASGMAVIYKKDDLDVFYLASVKDKELIDEANNKFVVVKVADGVKKEVKEMFASALETEYGKLVIII